MGIALLIGIARIGLAINKNKFCEESRAFRSIETRYIYPVNLVDSRQIMAHVVRERSTVNNSSSKQQFAFSKASRFSSPKPPTKAFGYEYKSSFT